MIAFLSMLARLLKPSFDSRVPPEPLGVYLASIPFVNGDAWEALR
jgi:hypothetical protein